MKLSRVHYIGYVGGQHNFHVDLVGHCPKLQM